MLRLRGSLLLLALAALSLAQTGMTLATPEIRRVGDKLACLCGSCKNSVGDCPMIMCHYSNPAREKIAGMQKAGFSDQAIIDEFVKKEGIRALVAPPAEGFSLVGWLMPFIAIGIGLVMIWMFLRRFRKPAAVPEIDPGDFDRYRDRIDKDLAKLD